MTIITSLQACQRTLTNSRFLIQTIELQWGIDTVLPPCLLLCFVCLCICHSSPACTKKWSLRWKFSNNPWCADSAWIQMFQWRSHENDGPSQRLTIEDNVPSTCWLHIPREWWVRVWQQPVGRSCPVLYDDIPTTDAALEDCEDHSPAVHTVHVRTAYYAPSCTHSTREWRLTTLPAVHTVHVSDGLLCSQLYTQYRWVTAYYALRRKQLHPMYKSTPVTETSTRSLQLLHLNSTDLHKWQSHGLVKACWSWSMYLLYAGPG